MFLEHHIPDHLRQKASVLFSKHSVPRWMVFMFDGVTVFLTFLVSYLLRYNFEPVNINITIALEQGLMVMLVYCVFSLVFRSFAGLIRHTTVRDIFNVLSATTTALTFLLVATLISRKAAHLTGIFNLPLSILLIHYVTLNATLFVVRIGVKMFYELVAAKPAGRRNVVIFGAGSMGVIVKQVVMDDHTGEFNVVALLDNDRKLQRKTLDGVPVYSPRKLTREFLDKYHINTMVFAIRKIPLAEKTEILNFAVNLGLEVLEVPAVNDWLNGQFQLDQLKKIHLEDLLRRDPIQINMKAIAGGLKGKTILVTGAAGSIGSELVRQLIRFDVGKLLLVDNAETPMFHLKGELRELDPAIDIHTYLADATNEIRMEQIFSRHRPDMVYHAAAYKHVPLLEENPHEAILGNVKSTMILTRLSQMYQVIKFVLVSSDKAVNPTNVMGASKRMCEMILQVRSYQPGNMVRFVITRFGNVLGSNGSVIPIFRKQIEKGGPVTVTHPDITRYFMTIPEACQLVLEAGFMGLGGEIFIFDMGDPVRIDDLARQMIRLSGLDPDKDIEIVYTGLRPGEKLYEELVATTERTLPTYNPKVKVCEVSRIDHDVVISEIHALMVSAPLKSKKELIRAIQQIVPEYQSSELKRAGHQEGPSAGPSSIELGVYPD